MKTNIYKNLKTGNHYIVVSDDTINCTNSANDQRMVTYRDKYYNYYTREYNEFHEKFKIAELPIEETIEKLSTITINEETGKRIISIDCSGLNLNQYHKIIDHVRNTSKNNLEDHKVISI